MNIKLFPVLLIVSVFANWRFSPLSKICAVATEDTVINDHNADNHNINNDVRNNNGTIDYSEYNDYNEYNQYAEYGRNK